MTWFVAFTSHFIELKLPFTQTTTHNLNFSKNQTNSPKCLECRYYFMICYVWIKTVKKLSSFSSILQNSPKHLLGVHFCLDIKTKWMKGVSSTLPKQKINLGFQRVCILLVLGRRHKLISNFFLRHEIGCPGFSTVCGGVVVSAATVVSQSNVLFSQVSGLMLSSNRHLQSPRHCYRGSANLVIHLQECTIF